MVSKSLYLLNVIGLLNLFGYYSRSSLSSFMIDDLLSTCIAYTLYRKSRAKVKVKVSSLLILWLLVSMYKLFACLSLCVMSFAICSLTFEIRILSWFWLVITPFVFVRSFHWKLKRLNQFFTCCLKA